MRKRFQLSLDLELLEQARRLTGITDETELIHRGLQALIERAARALANLGGSAPKLRPLQRRRPAAG